MRLSDEEKRNTISDLKKYPDWLIRIECDGLGGELVNIGGCWDEDFENKDYRKSIIEEYVEFDDDIKRKIFAIERVFERLQKDMKKIIRLRYFLPGNTPQDIQSILGLSKSLYFRLHNSALISFARALGYII